MLRESISNLPVVIVEKKILKEILDQEIFENIDNIICGKYLPGEEFKNNYNFRIIPYSSLGNENGVLFGFKPDYITLYIDDEFEKKEVYIGIYKGSLCGNLNYYNAIVGL